jgi:hypothetical protein
LIYFVGYTLLMSNDSTGEKIKDKLMGTKDKLKETVGMGGEEGERANKKDGELGPGAATELEEEVAKTSSDSPTKRVEGQGKALGKEEGSA